MGCSLSDVLSNSSETNSADQRSLTAQKLLTWKTVFPDSTMRPWVQKESYLVVLENKSLDHHPLRLKWRRSHSPKLGRQSLNRAQACCSWPILLGRSFLDPNYARHEPVDPVSCYASQAGREAGRPSRKELAYLLSIALTREIQHPSRLAGERGGKRHVLFTLLRPNTNIRQVCVHWTQGLLYSITLAVIVTSGLSPLRKNHLCHNGNCC